MLSSSGIRWITVALFGIAIAAPVGLGVWKRQRIARVVENERAATAGVAAIRGALLFLRQPENAGKLKWDGTLAGLGALIPPEVAAADPGRPDARPHQGYWFVLLAAEGDKPPTACAYPARYRSTGRGTYIATFDHGHLKADTQGVPPPRSPSEAELKSGWSKVD